MSMDFDIQVLLRRSGADIAMFLTAMLAYWILQRVRERAAAPIKTPCKETCDQECPSDCNNQVFNTPQALPVANKENVEPLQTDVVHPQTKNAAVKKGKGQQQQPKRSEVAAGPFNVSDQMALMRNHAASRNIKETLQVLRTIQQNNEPVTSSMQNTVLQAWINCGNIWAAENCMEEMREAGLVDETSYVILIKALVPIGDLDKARLLLHEMKEKVPLPSVGSFDELLLCFARGGLFNEGVALLSHMQEVGIEPSQSTLCTIAKLVNNARFINQRSAEIWKVLAKYSFDVKCVDEISQKYPSELPRLLAVLSDTQTHDAKKCIHDVDIKGSISEINGLRVTLMQSDLGLTDEYTFGAHGQRDMQQDGAKRAQVAAALRCVSKQGLRIPWNLEEVMLQYLGSDVHFLRLNFESTSMRAAVVDEISCRHPRLGFRHCWVKPSSGSCGQRTLSNGEEIDEASFNRHINAGYVKEMN